MCSPKSYGVPVGSVLAAVCLSRSGLADVPAEAPRIAVGARTPPLAVEGTPLTLRRALEPYRPSLQDPIQDPIQDQNQFSRIA